VLRYEVILMNVYYVVAFSHDNPLAKDNRFHYEGVQLLKQSIQRIPRGMTKEDATHLGYAVVYSLPLLPPDVRQRVQEGNDESSSVMHLLQEQLIEAMINPPPEYEPYEKVYFLNEVALRMYQEGGIAIDILRTISEGELPKQCSRSLRGPYIPR